MKYVALPFQEPRRLSFYLAMEEFVARHTDEPDAFFMWQVEPSVIFGRNQVLENEVNVAYCREHGISLYRRKSGGGCVYADMDNLMLSFVTSEENVVVRHFRGERELRLQPLCEYGIAGAAQTGHRRYGYQS